MVGGPLKLLPGIAALSLTAAVSALASVFFRLIRETQIVLAACLVAMIGTVSAEDWPQFRGPDRSGVSKESGLLQAWPEAGPPLLWTYRQGGVGFSPPAIVGNWLYSMGAHSKEGANEKTDCVYALDVQTGRQLWSTPIGPMVPMDWGDGPCATPTVDGELLFALTTAGEMHCLETATGKRIWRVNLKEDFGGAVLHEGRYTESPLIDGDKLICSPGGQLGTLAALDKKTGRTIWRSKDTTDEAVCSSPIVVNVGGLRQYVNLNGKGVAGVAAEDGRLLWNSDIPKAWIMVPTPIFFDDHIYVTSAYGVGCGLVKLARQGDGITAVEVYRNKVMKNHHGGVILVDGYLYGHSDPSGWVCQEFKTGKMIWVEKNALGKGSITCADRHFYCFSEKGGTLALIEATPSGWKETGRFTIPEESKLPRRQGLIWTPPVVSNGRLYLRDQDLLFCYDIANHTR